MKWNWNLMNLAVKHLSVSAIRDWKEIFLGMEIWMQAVVVAAGVLLVGACILSCWWGLKMKRAARFLSGAASVFFITIILLTSEYSMDALHALIYAGIAAGVSGVLYAFLERVFQFAAGFVFGCVLSAYVLPQFFHMKLTAGRGRIWGLVIACAAGVLFALLAKKLKMVLTALEGGVVLGLLCDAYLPVTKIPWIKDRLTEAQIYNLLPLVIAATGLIVQFLQWLGIRAEQKALQVPSNEERDHGFGKETQPDAGKDAPADESRDVDEEDVSMAQAEEVLVEKAKELALAASKNTQKARLKERYEDVSEGIYTTEVAARRLGMTEEAFTKGMTDAGYTIPGKDPAAPDPEQSTAEETAKPEEGASDEPVKTEDGAAEGAAKPEEGASDESGKSEEEMHGSV